VPSGRRRAVRIGCSGWNYASWKEPFYGGRPARGWLAHYARHFDTVEVNNTFYRLPRPEAVASWERTVPDRFCFAVKTSRYLTHVKRLRDLGPGLERFEASIEPLARSPKLGPILWQLPPNFHRDDDRLAAALESFPSDQRHAIEFRHRSWFADDVYALLRGRGVALVLTGDVEVHTAPWTYVRFHRGRRGRRGNYSESELEEWAVRFERWARDVEIYAYFNNDWEAFAVKNALWLKRRLSGRTTGRLLR
jgi:uncharacterized protein YecE (DUF72 family)